MATPAAIDLDQVLYARARWRKTILIPLWTFQMLVLLCLMGLFAYRLAETFDNWEQEIAEGKVPVVEVVWEATNVGFNTIALILNIIEISRKATECLTPFLMVCTHILKLTLSFAVLALDIVAVREKMDNHYSTIGLSLDCGLLAATLSSFVYAVHTYRRLLKYEDYHLTANARQQLYGQLAEDRSSTQLGGRRVSKFYNRTYTTEYHEDYADSFYTRTEYPSQLSRVSRQSLTYSPYSSSIPQQAPDPVPPPSLTGEELKRQIDRALGSEFGWDSNTAAAAAAVAIATREVSPTSSDGQLPPTPSTTTAVTATTTGGTPGTTSVMIPTPTSSVAPSIAAAGAASGSRRRSGSVVVGSGMAPVRHVHSESVDDGGVRVDKSKSAEVVFDRGQEGGEVSEV